MAGWNGWRLVSRNRLGLYSCWSRLYGDKRPEANSAWRDERPYGSELLLTAEYFCCDMVESCRKNATLLPPRKLPADSRTELRYVRSASVETSHRRIKTPLIGMTVGFICRPAEL